MWVRIANASRQKVPEPNLRESLSAKKMARKYPEAAINKMNELADQGSLTSLLHLGQIYSAGSFVPKDFALSERYFRRAADAGSYHGYVALGALYLLQEKFEAAHKAIFAAAGKGYPPALTLLAQLYWTGSGGFGRDRDKARQLLDKAAERGSLRARVLIGRTLISESKKAFDPIRGALLFVGALAQAILVLIIEGRSSDRLR